MGFPIIIKPSRLGSSIGIRVCKSIDCLDCCIKSCLKYDKKLLIEKFIDVKKEVNIAVLNNKGKLIVSNSEEPISSNDILNFEDYLIIRELVDRAEAKGSKYITDIAYSTLTSMLSKVKKEYGVECELAGWHGIRKLSISDYYNMIRQEYDKRTSIGMANLRLGHGFDRGVSALKTYVQNIW